jgi:hypothetical protein
MGTLTIRWKIQWTVGDFLACAIKMQHLCLLRCALDRVKTCFYQTHANNMSWVYDGSEPLILSMIRVTHDYYHHWYVFGSPNRGTKQPLRGCQEWDVSVPVRFTMLRLSCVQWDNGKCSFVNEMFAQMRTIHILSDAFKYMAAGLSSCQGLFTLGCCRTPSGTSTNCTTEGVFDWRCRIIDVPKHTLMKTEHVSSIYANETVSVLVLVFTC